MQFKVWLLGISPMVWRRMLVPDTCTLRELHGTIQVAMGREDIHLYQFRLRSCRYGSWEVSSWSPDVTPAELKLRRGVRFTYEYDLNIPWRHEVRIEETRLDAGPGKALPRYIAGDGACLSVTQRHPEAAVVVLPRTTAVPSNTAESAPTQRDGHLQHIAEHGRMAWQSTSGYNRRARVEATISRWKQVIGDALRAHTDERRATEAALAVHALNRVLDLGRPSYVRVA